MNITYPAAEFPFDFTLKSLGVQHPRFSHGLIPGCLERLSLLERSSSRRRRANSNSPVILALHLYAGAEYEDISLHCIISHCMTCQILIHIIFACIYTSIMYHISALLRIPINPYLWGWFRQPLFGETTCFGWGRASCLWCQGAAVLASANHVQILLLWWMHASEAGSFVRKKVSPRLATGSGTWQRNWRSERMKFDREASFLNTKHELLNDWE